MQIETMAHNETPEIRPLSTFAVFALRYELA
ncbi:hypothetical protein SAMN05216573_10255 [Bradyrhizobium sp. Rc3b]|nr:hypothetical protein SAMN05216573_10255 [Bradyrhizobium sp. Rc3b]